MSEIEVGAIQDGDAHQVLGLLSRAGVSTAVRAGAFVIDARRGPAPSEVQALRALAALRTKLIPTRSKLCILNSSQENVALKNRN